MNPKYLSPLQHLDSCETVRALIGSPTFGRCFWTSRFASGCGACEIGWEVLSSRAITKSSTVCPLQSWPGTDQSDRSGTFVSFKSLSSCQPWSRLLCPYSRLLSCCPIFIRQLWHASCHSWSKGLWTCNSDRDPASTWSASTPPPAGACFALGNSWRPWLACGYSLPSWRLISSSSMEANDSSYSLILLHDFPWLQWRRNLSYLCQSVSCSGLCSHQLLQTDPLRWTQCPASWWLSWLWEAIAIEVSFCCWRHFVGRFTAKCSSASRTLASRYCYLSSLFLYYLILIKF